MLKQVLTESSVHFRAPGGATANLVALFREVADWIESQVDIDLLEISGGLRITDDEPESHVTTCFDIDLRLDDGGYIANKIGDHA